MNKNLTNSQLDRKNILNNDIALEEIQKNIDIQGLIFEDKIVFTKSMLCQFYGVEERTIERYLSDNSEELNENGYQVLKGKKLKDFITTIKQSNYTSMEDVNFLSKTTVLGIFDFRAFLNIGMLLIESESAKVVRQRILDIVIDVLNKKTGGATKYINQRDMDFHLTFLQDENYHKEFTDALKDYTNMDNSKYSIYTNKIYQSIFRENAEEYRQILRLNEKDNVRKTLYAEILKIVHAYECGLAEELKKKFECLGRPLYHNETEEVFLRFESQALWKPLTFDARIKMASRDLALREAFHIQLKDYIKPLEKSEFEKFLGHDSDLLVKLMEENQDVLKRLKDRD